MAKPVEKITKKPTTTEEIYLNAINILKEREEDYGDFEQSLTHITNYWNVFLTDHGFIQKPLKPRDTSVMLSLFKTARLLKSFETKDTFIDGCNYLTQAYASRKAESSMSSTTKTLKSFTEKQKEGSEHVRFTEAVMKRFKPNTMSPKDREKVFARILKIVEEVYNEAMANSDNTTTANDVA